MRKDNRSELSHLWKLCWRANWWRTRMHVMKLLFEAGLRVDFQSIFNSSVLVNPELKQHQQEPFLHHAGALCPLVIQYRLICQHLFDIMTKYRFGILLKVAEWIKMINSFFKITVTNTADPLNYTKQYLKHQPHHIYSTCATKNITGNVVRLHWLYIYIYIFPIFSTKNAKSRGFWKTESLICT